MSRRRFLRTLAGTAGYAKLSSVPAVASAAPSAYPFEEVSSAASRITWVHTAGKSPEKYLPETTGAGCAFLDYDNDGWMDIYLVNSGKCDFYNPNPPLRNAMYRNNRDGTFTDVTEKAGVAGKGYGQGDSHAASAPGQRSNQNPACVLGTCEGPRKAVGSYQTCRIATIADLLLANVSLVCARQPHRRGPCMLSPR